MSKQNRILRRMLVEIRVWWIFLGVVTPLSAAAIDLSSYVIGIATESDLGKFQSSGVFVERNLVASGCVGAYPARLINTILEGGAPTEGVLVYHDSLRNICLIKVALVAPINAKLARSAIGSNGTSVVVAGVGKDNIFKSTDGKILSRARDPGQLLGMRTDAPVFNGAAGAGVFDPQDYLVGILDIVGGKSGEFSSITPASWIQKAMNDLSAGKDSANDGNALANATLRAFALDQGSPATCALTPQDDAAFQRWSVRRSAILQTVTSADRFPSSLTREVLFCEARRAHIDPDLLLALLENFGIGSTVFDPANVGDTHSNTTELGPIPVGVMQINGWRLNRVVDSSPSALSQLRASLESPEGNLRAGLSVLKVYLDATDNNAALAVHSYLLQMALVPEIFALQISQKTISSLNLLINS